MKWPSTWQNNLKKGETSFGLIVLKIQVHGYGGRVAHTTVARKQKDEERPLGPNTTCTFVISHKLMFSSIKIITNQGQSIQHMSLSKAFHIQPKISHACPQRIAALL